MKKSLRPSAAEINADLEVIDTTEVLEVGTNGQT